MNHKKSVSNNW